MFYKFVHFQHHSELFNFTTANTSADFRSRICAALEDHSTNLDFPVDQLTFKQQMAGIKLRQSGPG